jgi:uncharacterized protein YjbK
MSDSIEVMLVEGKYKVVVDKYNHILYKYNKGGYEVRNVRTKELGIKEAGWENMEKFFPNVRQALSYVIGLEVLEESEYSDVVDYINQLRELGNTIGGGFDK